MLASILLPALLLATTAAATSLAACDNNAPPDTTAGNFQINFFSDDSCTVPIAVTPSLSVSVPCGCIVGPGRSEASDCLSGVIEPLGSEFLSASVSNVDQQLFGQGITGILGDIGDIDGNSPGSLRLTNAKNCAKYPGGNASGFDTGVGPSDEDSGEILNE